MTMGQLELPLFVGIGEPCECFSVGQRCRYYANHSGDHTFGGGMGDPVHLKRCADPAGHPAHVWSDGSFACSGRRRD